MVIIPPTPTFLSKGAIVPDKREIEVIIYALLQERDRVVRAMSIEELNVLISRLQQYQKQRGD